MSGLISATSSKVEERSPCCSKPFLAVSIIVSLAVAIIGALALSGFLCPGSSLGGLGNAFGEIGSIATLASGGVALLVIVAIGMCCSKTRTSSSVQETRELLSSRKRN